jgi:hypothetical protein
MEIDIGRSTSFQIGTAAEIPKSLSLMIKIAIQGPSYLLCSLKEVRYDQGAHDGMTKFLNYSQSRQCMLCNFK